MVGACFGVISTDVGERLFFVEGWDVGRFFR